jgi:TolB protein
LTNDPAGDNSPVWSPVANEIAFVSNRFGNSDILLLTTAGGVSTLTTNFAPDSAPAWSPGGSTIAFQKYSGELVDLCLINRDGLGQECITSFPAEYGAPVWSPDGNWLAANARQNTGYGIDLFNVVDGSTMQLYSAGIEPRGEPIWSPDGARLAFQAQSDGDMELYMAVMPTNEFTRLTSVDAYDGEPVWTDQ